MVTKQGDRLLLAAGVFPDVRVVFCKRCYFLKRIHLYNRNRKTSFCDIFHVILAVVIVKVVTSANFLTNFLKKMYYLNNSQINRPIMEYC